MPSVMVRRRLEQRELSTTPRLAQRERHQLACVSLVAW
jgi:hypothetical protein